MQSSKTCICTLFLILFIFISELTQKDLFPLIVNNYFVLTSFYPISKFSLVFSIEFWQQKKSYQFNFLLEQNNFTNKIEQFKKIQQRQQQNIARIANMNQNPFLEIKRDIQFLENNIQSDPNVMKLKISKHRKSNTIYQNQSRIKDDTINRFNRDKHESEQQVSNIPKQKLDYQIQRAKRQYELSLKQYSQINQTYNRIYKDCQQSIKRLSRDLSSQNQLEKLSNASDSQKIKTLTRHINALQGQNDDIRRQKQMMAQKLGQAMKLMQKYEIIIHRNEARSGDMINQQIAEQNEVLWIKIQDYETRLQQIIQKVQKMEASNLSQRNFGIQPEEFDRRNFSNELKKSNKRYLESLNIFHQSMKHFENRFAGYLQTSEGNISQVIQVRRAALQVQQNVNKILENNQKCIRQFNHLKQKNKELSHKVKVGSKTTDQASKRLMDKINGYDKLVKKLSGELERAIMYNYNFNIKRQKLGTHVQNYGKENSDHELMNNFKQLQYKMHNINQQISSLSKGKQEASQKISREQVQHYKNKCKILQEKVLQLEKSNLQYQLIPTSKKNEETLRKEVLAKSQQILVNQSEIKRLKELLAQRERVLNTQKIDTGINISKNSILQSNNQRDKQLAEKYRQLYSKYQQVCVSLQKCQACLIQRQQRILLITQQYETLKKIYDKVLKQLQQLRAKQQIFQNRLQVRREQPPLRNSKADFLKGDQLSQSAIKNYLGKCPDIAMKLEIEIQYKESLIRQFKKQLISQQDLLNKHLTNQLGNYDSDEVQMTNQRIFILSTKIDNEKENIKILKYKIKQLEFYQSQVQQKQYWPNQIMSASVQQLADQVKLLQYKLYEANRLNSEMHMSRITHQIQNNQVSQHNLEKVMEDYQYTKKNLNVYRDKSLLQEQVIQNLRRQVKHLKGQTYDQDRTKQEKQRILRKVQTIRVKKTDSNQKVEFQLTPKDLQDRLLVFKQRQDSRQSLKNKSHQEDTHGIVQTQSRQEFYSASSNKVNSQFYFLSSSSQQSNQNFSKLSSLGLMKNNDSKQSIDEHKQIALNSHQQTIKIEQNDDSLEEATGN